MNKQALQSLITLLKIDPSGLNVEAHSIRSTIPAKNCPVNLCEHLAHLLRIDYQSQQFKLNVSLAAALDIDRAKLCELCDLSRWPNSLRGAYRLASTDRERAHVVIRRVEYFITLGASQ